MAQVIIWADIYQGAPMTREEDFTQDLQERLRSPEFAVYFVEAQVESARELLRCGIITSLDETGNSNKTKVSDYE